MNITITIPATDLNKIARIPENFKKGITRGLTKAMIFAEEQAKLRFNTKGNLHIRSGDLKRSIRSGAEGNVGWLGTNLFYGEVNELGKTILPKKGKYLRFVIMGRVKFAKEVVIHPRPFIRPAVEENAIKLGDIIMISVMETI
jgi:phage gpG-like protein